MKSLQLPAVVLLLLSGATGFIRAETVHEVSVGGNITVGCQFYWGGKSTKIFCKGDCEKGTVLVKTSENNICEKRYCIEHKGKWYGYEVMYVSITNVAKSDDGQYQCVLERTGLDGYQQFQIKVTKDAAQNPTYTLKPEGSSKVAAVSPVKLTPRPGDPASVFTVTTTAHSVTQGSFYSSTSSKHQPHTPGPGQYLDGRPEGTPGSLESPALYVGLVLAVVVVLLAAALLIFFCNKRQSKPKEHPESTEYEQIPELNRVYEEIQDPPNSGSRPAEISTVYAAASFSKPAQDQTSDIYSLATAATNQTDDSASVTYTEVDLPQNDSAPRRQTEAVLYSAVQTQSEGTLYSTVSAPQQ